MNPSNPANQTNLNDQNTSDLDININLPDDSMPHADHQAQNQHSAKQSTVSDADGFGDWGADLNANANANANGDQSFEFKDEPLYVDIAANQSAKSPHLSINQKTNQTHLNHLKNVNDDVEQIGEEPQGQLLNLEDDINPSDIEQQVDYALTQKNNFMQKHLKKIALLGVAICGGGVAVALANFKTKVTVAQTTTVEQVVVPNVDKSKLEETSIAEKEQRNIVDQQQAQNALNNGQTYTPEFAPQGLQPAQLMPPPPPPEMPPVQAAPEAALPPAPAETPMPPQPPVDTLSSDEIGKVRESVFGQVDNLVKANNGQNGFNTVVYGRKSNEKEAAANFYNQMPDGQQAKVAAHSNNGGDENTGKSAKKKYRILAGGMMYATLNQAINSDDGMGAVFATIHGGPFNKGTLIGKMEEAPNNIRLTFSQITMPDGETVDIAATAIREKDARAGMAEGVDNHTISRYSYLFISSFVKGLSQFAKPPSTLMATGNTLLESQEAPQTKNLVRGGLSDAGQAMSSESKQNFNRAPTYTIPQNQGFAVLMSKNVE